MYVSIGSSRSIDFFLGQIFRSNKYKWEKSYILESEEEIASGKNDRYGTI